MANMFRTAVIGCGLAGVLAVAAVPSSAQVVVEPYYGAYAYAPGYGYRSWDYPAGYDTGGVPYSYRDLGWQPGWPGTAPANPCYPTQRMQNRC